jgi:hypothetical protein
MVWFLQVLSAALSHKWAKRRELRPQDTRPSTCFSIGAFAVYTRLAGNALAFLNAGFLATFSILQFTNLYDNCWCSASAFQQGINSYVLIYAIPGQIFAASKTWYIVGTFMAIACVAICLGLFITAERSGRDCDG